MSSHTFPGIHPSFKMDEFPPAEQRVLQRLSRLFHLTSYSKIQIGKGSKYRYALIKPSTDISGMVHSEREIILLFSDYPEFQPRTLDAFDRIIDEISDKYRVEKVVRILVSGDSQLSTKLRSLFKTTPDSPVVVPFHYDEAGSKLSDQSFFDRFSEFTFSRDLFSISSPLRRDIYFYGRSNLINEIMAKIASGENFGLFGLRRSGKTSIVNGVYRASANRNIKSIVIDCQNPSVHKRRWNDLLYYIANQIREHYGVSANLRGQDKYTEVDAADSFFGDILTLKGKMKVEKIALLFDEFERIAFGTASSSHWNEDEDFLSLWQALRYGFQSENSPFTYLLVGTNPKAIEESKIRGSDNPLFGNIEKRYIPMFDLKTVEEMVSDLGRVMGLSFSEDVFGRLYEDFGGHPFLTRHACSYISLVSKDRPLQIDRTIYDKGKANFLKDSNTYVDSVVELLREQYPLEFELLKLLAEGKYDDFSYFAHSDPKMVQHVIGYGIVESGKAAHYFRVGAIKRYFESLEKSPAVMTQEARREEIGRRMNDLESGLRRTIRTVFFVAYHPNERKQKLLSKVSDERRGKFSNYSFEDLLSDETCPLFLSELCEAIRANWEKFENLLQMKKQKFEHLSEELNIARRFPSHAKDMSEHDFDKARVALTEVENSLGI